MKKKILLFSLYFLLTPTIIFAAGQYFYRQGVDIFNANNNKKISLTEWNKNWSGKSQEVQQFGSATSTVPTNKTPYLNANNTWTKENIFNGTTTTATTTLGKVTINKTLTTLATTTLPYNTLIDNNSTVRTDFNSGLVLNGDWWIVGFGRSDSGQAVATRTISNTISAADNKVTDIATPEVLDSTKNFSFTTVLKTDPTLTLNCVLFGLSNGTAVDPSFPATGKCRQAGNTDYAEFVVSSDAKVHAVWGNSGVNSSSTITGITPTNYNSYTIKRVGSSINYYVNRILKYTAITDLPDSTALGIHWLNSSGSGGGTKTMTVKRGYYYSEPN